MTPEEIKQELALASIEMVRSFPFYGHILVQLERLVQEADERISTMGVGKRHGSEMLLKLFVARQFVDDIYARYSTGRDQSKAFVCMVELMKHEVLHIVFGHLAQVFPDKNRGAVAVDCEVNSFLERSRLPESGVYDKHSGVKSKAGCFPEDYGFEKKKGAMWYYHHLASNDQYQQQCKDGQFGKDGAMSRLMSSHKLWDEAAQDETIGDMMKDLVRHSARICKETNQWGSVPGDIMAQLEELIKPKRAVIPWQHILRVFVASATESNLSYTMKRRSRRYGTRPGTRKEDILNLAVGIDTSGSVSDEQLGLFFNELRWIEKNGATVTVFECDTEIHREYPASKFDGKAAGRGGTDLEPILARCDERRFDGLVMFTDFYTPKMKKLYRVPILWVLSQCEYTREQYPYPKGIFMHINPDMTVRMG